jgi:GT2 family glycosyltransferase
VGYGVTISVVIVNFNGARWLSLSLPSLHAQTLPPTEILVVDNGSSDDSHAIAQRYDARFLALGSNRGFAVANNLGALQAFGDILVFLNNDMRFAPTFLAELTRPLSDPLTFAADAQQLTLNEGILAHAATRLNHRGFVRSLTSLGIDIEQYATGDITTVLQACAANMAVRREVFLDLGGFDARLPAGWEDTEICWRAALKGLRSVYVPTALCWHKISATSATEPGRTLRYRGDVGGRLLFATKHLPFEMALLLWGSTILKTVAEAAVGRWQSARRHLMVLREFGSFIPALIWERCCLYSAAKRSPRQHLETLLKIGKPVGA